MSGICESCEREFPDVALSRQDAGYLICVECAVEESKVHKEARDSIRRGAEFADQYYKRRIAVLSESYLRLKTAYLRNEREICDTLGAALGYPRYCDDQDNFPGATADDGYVVGNSTAIDLAHEIARRLKNP